MRYAPLYIISFALTPSRLWQIGNHRGYDELQSVSDRLRWCRYSKGLSQVEAAQQLGMSSGAYRNIEDGSTQHIPEQTAQQLAQFYDISVTDLMDEFTRFLDDGQACRIRDCRKRLGMGRKAFARHMGIPLTSLRCWENGQKVISRKCWEKYFKDRV